MKLHKKNWSFVSPTPHASRFQPTLQCRQLRIPFHGQTYPYGPNALILILLLFSPFQKMINYYSKSMTSLSLNPIPIYTVLLFSTTIQQNAICCKSGKHYICWFKITIEREKEKTEKGNYVIEDSVTPFTKQCLSQSVPSFVLWPSSHALIPFTTKTNPPCPSALLFQFSQT